MLWSFIKIIPGRTVDIGNLFKTDDLAISYVLLYKTWEYF